VARRGVVLGKNALLRSISETLFSYNALDRSRKTFRRSYKGITVYHRKDGFFLMRNPKGASSETTMLETVKGFLGPGGHYNDIKRVDRSLGEFEALLLAANAKGVKTDLFISPTHAALMETLDVAGLWKTYEAWKRRLAAMASRHKATLWDFGGYTALSTVPLSEAQGSFIDASHYRPAVGKRLLAIMGENTSSPAFGRRLTSENIASELAAQREARKTYRTNRPDDAKRIRAAACSVPKISRLPSCL